MEMALKRRNVLSLCLLSFAGLFACGKTVDTAEPTIHVSGQYYEELDTIEALMKYSTNVVEATLLSKEPFGSDWNVYLFEVRRDLAGNAPDEIHMYGADDERYIAGHTYHLFLEGTDTALFPHTIYTTVGKDLVIDLTASEETATVSVGDPSAESGVSLAELEAAVTDTVDEGIFGEALEEPMPISNAESLDAVAGEADVIAEVRVSHEANSHPYASTYSVELVNLLKGPENSVASSISLPPALDPGPTYYIFLKEEPSNPGSYTLFSRVYPALEASEETAAALSLE